MRRNNKQREQLKQLEVKRDVLTFTAYSAEIQQPNAKNLSNIPLNKTYDMLSDYKQLSNKTLQNCKPGQVNTEVQLLVLDQYKKCMQKLTKPIIERLYEVPYALDDSNSYKASLANSCQIPFSLFALNESEATKQQDGLTKETFATEPQQNEDQIPYLSTKEICTNLFLAQLDSKNEEISHLNFDIFEFEIRKSISKLMLSQNQIFCQKLFIINPDDSKFKKSLLYLDHKERFLLESTSLSYQQSFLSQRLAEKKIKQGSNPDEKQHPLHQLHLLSIQFESLLEFVEASLLSSDFTCSVAYLMNQYSGLLNKSLASLEYQAFYLMSSMNKQFETYMKEFINLFSQVYFLKTKIFSKKLIQIAQQNTTPGVLKSEIEMINKQEKRAEFFFAQIFYGMKRDISLHFKVTLMEELQRNWLKENITQQSEKPLVELIKILKEEVRKVSDFKLFISAFEETENGIVTNKPQWTFDFSKNKKIRRMTEELSEILFKILESGFVQVSEEGNFWKVEYEINVFYQIFLKKIMKLLNYQTLTNNTLLFQSSLNYDIPQFYNYTNYFINIYLLKGILNILYTNQYKISFEASLALGTLIIQSLKSSQLQKQTKSQLVPCLELQHFFELITVRAAYWGRILSVIRQILNALIFNSKNVGQNDISQYCTNQGFDYSWLKSIKKGSFPSGTTLNKLQTIEALLTS